MSNQSIMELVKISKDLKKKKRINHNPFGNIAYKKYLEQNKLTYLITHITKFKRFDHFAT